MGFFKKNKTTVSRVEMIQQRMSNYFTFNGKLYESDIIKSCIRPDVKAIGKCVVKHIRNYNDKIETNPEPYLKFLFMQPNPWMTMQQMIEKVETTRLLNNNAFILINRDENGYPFELYPINALSVEAIFDKDGFLYYRFLMKNSKYYNFNSMDIIHIKSDVYEDDIFGTPPTKSLLDVMNVITTTDQGIVNTIKNSGVVRWLLKFNISLKADDIKKHAKDFSDNYLKINSNGEDDENFGGVAAADSKYDAVQIKHNDYVPNAMQMNTSIKRLKDYFNTNDKIITSSYTEDEWNSYYEAKIEPEIIQLSDLFTLKIFTRKEIAFGNSVIFESSNLQYASLSTKLAFVSMVDRGALIVNDWRALFGWGPIEGGDKPIRRLDTAQIDSAKGGDE